MSRQKIWLRAEAFPAAAAAAAAAAGAHRISTSPKFPENVPSTHSSVLASCRFM